VASTNANEKSKKHNAKQTGAGDAPFTRRKNTKNKLGPSKQQQPTATYAVKRSQTVKK
jgi:hypothetical protein